LVQCKKEKRKEALGVTQEVARRFQQMAAGNGVHGAAPARKSSEVQAPRAAGGAGKGSAMVQGMAT